MFEPEPVNLKRILENFGGRTGVEIHNFGFANENSFSRILSSGSTSRLTTGDYTQLEDEYENVIELRTMDSVISTLDPPTFLKMDIEGSEESALIGGRQMINEHAPKMALSVYHKVNDFWKIPLQVLEYQPNYQIRLRHYTESIYETVAFFTT
jgi:FkbM family methyltransferase